jgi:hypothetical protein
MRGGLLLGDTDRAIGLIDPFAQCFTDSQLAELIEQTVAAMIGRRVFGSRWATRTWLIMTRAL